MCDICEKAGQELQEFAEGLEKKYPGTSVQGHTVTPLHHVFVATQVLADIYAIKEGKAMVELEAKKRGMSIEQLENEFLVGQQGQQFQKSGTSSPLFGGKQKDIAA